MMYFDERPPNIFTPTILLLLFVGVSILPSVLTLDPVQIGGVGLASLILLAAGCASAWNWGAYQANCRRRERREADAITVRSVEMERIGHLTPEQLALVTPPHATRAEIDEDFTAQGPVYSLRTPLGPVPMEWVIDYLKDSGITYLRPIRTYADGTVGREYSRRFVEWAVMQHLCVSSGGNQPASWLNEHARSVCYKMLGVEE